LLRDDDYDRQTKLAVCFALVEHAKENHATSPSAVTFLQCTLAKASRSSDAFKTCEILLEAGTDPCTRALHVVVQDGKDSVCRLLLQYSADPFRQDDDAEEDDEPNSSTTSSSPFQAAACQISTSILELFLAHWDSQSSSASSSGGMDHKNGNNCYPIHAICRRNKHMSLQAIELVMKRPESENGLLMSVVGVGLFPFQEAAACDANLDVIFYLLKYCPSALKAATAAPAAAPAAAATEIGDATAAEIGDGKPQARNDCLEDFSIEEEAQVDTRLAEDLST
jgi:hypothetical protein